LLNAGADFNRVTSQGTPLFQAVEYKSDRTFDLILEAINSVPGTDGGKLAALWHASENGYVWALKRFVASNTDVHTKRSNGCNALSDAVNHDQYESSRLLIDAGIDFEGQASYLGGIFHGNPLYIASKKGNSKIVTLLVERGANVNACNYYQQTALHSAAYQGGVNMVQLLLDQGGDVHARNQIGETALHFSARRGDLKAIAMLLDRGADIDAWCEVDGSALFIAWTWGHIDAVALLIERGADITEY
jgi:ankyrin repeat protein